MSLESNEGFADCAYFPRFLDGIWLGPHPAAVEFAGEVLFGLEKFPRDLRRNESLTGSGGQIEKDPH